MIEQAVQEAGKSAASIVLDAGVVGLVITNIFMLAKQWLQGRQEREKAQAVAEEAEAKALQAQAQAMTGRTDSGNGKLNGHQLYLLPHTAMLERHDAELKAVKESTARVERENREDHEKIFQKLDDLKDLIQEAARQG